MSGSDGHPSKKVENDALSIATGNDIEDAWTNTLIDTLFVRDGKLTDDIKRRQKALTSRFGRRMCQLIWSHSIYVTEEELTPYGLKKPLKTLNNINCYRLAKILCRTRFRRFVHPTGLVKLPTMWQRIRRFVTAATHYGLVNATRQGKRDIVIAADQRLDNLMRLYGGAVGKILNNHTRLIGYDLQEKSITPPTASNRKVEATK